jgi:hypothetical protein
MSIEIPLTESEKHWNLHPSISLGGFQSRMGGHLDTGQGHTTGLVRVSSLLDMPGNRIDYGTDEYDTETVDNIIRDLQSKGPERGLRNPIVVGYHRDSHMGMVDEGNHRVLAAHMAGHEFLPTHVMRLYTKPLVIQERGQSPKYLSGEKKTWPWAQQVNRGVDEHHPGYMHPRWIFHPDDVLH